MAAMVIHTLLQWPIERLARYYCPTLLWAAMLWGQTSHLHLLRLRAHRALTGAWTCCRRSQTGTSWGCNYLQLPKSNSTLKIYLPLLRLHVSLLFWHLRISCWYVVLWSNSFMIFFFSLHKTKIQVCIRHCRQVSWRNFLPEGRHCQQMLT